MTLELSNEEARLLRRILTSMNDVWDWHRDEKNPIVMYAKVELVKDKSIPDIIHRIAEKLPKERLN